MNYEHKKHDHLLVTRFAAGDSYPAERGEAQKLVSSCSECAELAGDIRVLVQRTQELPAPARPRDFRISREDAERLRGSWFERLMRRFAAPGWGSAMRPVAGAAMAIGLTMAVVGSLPMGAGAPLPQGDTRAGAPMEHEPMATDRGVAAPGAGAPAAAEGTDGKGAQMPADSPVSVTDDIDNVYILRESESEGESDPSSETTSAAPQEASALLVGGLATAVLALGVLLLSLLARRRFADPLLR